MERLVIAYNNKNTPDALKQEIIKKPHMAVGNLDLNKIKKCRGEDKNDEDLKFDSSLRLLLKLVSDLEVHISTIKKEDIIKYSRILNAVHTSLKRFIKLIGCYCISQGKFKELNQGKGVEQHGSS